MYEPVGSSDVTGRAVKVHSTTRRLHRDMQVADEIPPGNAGLTSYLNCTLAFLNCTLERQFGVVRRFYHFLTFYLNTASLTILVSTLVLSPGQMPGLA